MHISKVISHLGLWKKFAGIGFHFYSVVMLTGYHTKLFFSKMGLDLIPRVDGEVVDADSTSVVELYKVVSFIAGYSVYNWMAWCKQA